MISRFKAPSFPLAKLIGGLGIGQIIGWGSSFYLPTILSAEIARDLAISEETVFGGITLMLIVNAVLAPWLGRRLDRHGSRSAMTIGAIILAGALLLLWRSTGIVSYFLAWLVMGVGGALFLTNSAFVAVAQLAGPGARRAMTVLMLFTGAVSSVAWPMLSIIDARVGWRATCLVLAGVLLSCAPMHWLLLKSKVETTSSSAPPRPLHEGLPQEKRATALAILAPCLCLAGFISWGLSVHLVELLRDLGAPREQAVWLASLLGVLQITSRAIELSLGARHSPLVTGIAAAALMALAFTVSLVRIPIVAPATGFIILYGIATGGMNLARIMIPLTLFGSRTYGHASGIIAFFQNIAFAIAPVVYAILFERIGVWFVQVSSVVAAAVIMLGFAVIIRITRA